MTAASTLDALLYVLRRGMACFDDRDNRRRLGDCDDESLKRIVAELRTWPAGRSWLRAWSEDEVAELTTLWKSERAKRGVANGGDPVRAA
jgi:hypothetical protein